MTGAAMRDAVPATFAGKAAVMVRRLHGRPVDGVPGWIVLSAYAASLTVLPSCVWRIVIGFGVPLGHPDVNGDMAGGLPSWLPLWVYAIILSVVSEALALLTVGLVSGWGEVFPRWIPFLGGRRVPVVAAVVPASLGAVVLTVATWSWAPSINDFTMPDGAVLHFSGWRLVVFVVAYGPLLAWGPLLAVVTLAYYLRRRRTG